MNQGPVEVIRLWHHWCRHYAVGGVRSSLDDLLGHDLVDALIAGKILVKGDPAEDYPCPMPGDPACPRSICHLPDGSIRAVCQQSPLACEDLILSEEDCLTWELNEA